MIAISADIDPVHKGHQELIKKAREIVSHLLKQEKKWHLH